MSAPFGERFTKTGQAHAQELASSPTPGAAGSGRLDLVGGIQQRQAEHDRLLGLCQQLRRQHRCPGRCVFTGELRHDGLAALRSMLDGLA